MVKILDFNCVRNLWHKVIVYMFTYENYNISANGYTSTTSEI